MAASEPELLALGRAIHDMLTCRSGRFPRVLSFSLYDHKRILEIRDLDLGEAMPRRIQFPDRVY